MNFLSDLKFIRNYSKLQTIDSVNNSASSNRNIKPFIEDLFPTFTTTSFYPQINLSEQHMQIDHPPFVKIPFEQPNPKQSQAIQPYKQTPDAQRSPAPAFKPQLNQAQIAKNILPKTQHVTLIQKQLKKSTYKKQTKSPTRNLINTTHRTVLMQSIHNSNDLILVYLMYKQQKLSLFLNKGLPFEYVIRKMYKEIYVYEKETYSISNAILKNLLYKITGFQSIDQDILYDYEFKYKRGTLDRQKFFIPFKQEDHKTPFKIYTQINPNPYGGDQFLARNYSDGEWIIVSTIRKSLFDGDKINTIKKSLKSNSMGRSLLLKNNSTSFCQINWLETKNYLIIVSEYSTETLDQNLTKNLSYYDEQKCEQIFRYCTKWLALTFKQIVSSNVQNFKKMSLKNVVLNPSDGQPRISVFDNLSNCIDFTQKPKSVMTNGKRASQKIQDNFYFQTYFNLVRSLKSHLKRSQKSEKIFNDFLEYIEEKNKSADFTFEHVYRYFSHDEMNSSISSNQKQKSKNPLKIDYTQRLEKIVSKIHQTKTNSNLYQKQTLLISQIKDEIQKVFWMQNMQKNQQRRQTKTMLQMLGRTQSFEIKKQNIGNVAEFKKQQQHKYTLKKKERIFIKQILNQLNQTDNFIRTTKQNNVASIQFYLKKSDHKVKSKMVQKIENKYKKFFQRKVTNFEDDNFNTNSSHITVNQECYIEDLNQDIDDKYQEKDLVLPSCPKSRKNLLADSYAIKQQSQIQVVNNLLDKENFASQILSRLQKRSSYGKVMQMSGNNKLNQSTYQSIQKNGSKLQQLFVIRKNYSKDEKIALNNKQYRIYLDQAQKQFSKLRLYKRAGKAGTDVMK